MNRKFALALVAAAATAGGMAWAVQESADKKIERHVIVRHAGGSFLGVTLGELEGSARGAKVRSVEPGSPAEKAGVKDGDVIVRFDGEAVRSASHLSRLVRETPPGREVALEVERAGAAQKLVATIGEGAGGRMRMFGGPDQEFDFELPVPPEPPEAPEAPEAPRRHSLPRVPAPPAPPAVPHAWGFEHGPGADMLFRMLPGGPRRLGLEYIELGDQLAAYFKLAGGNGVLVTSVDADGPAAKAGLKAGDVILKFGERAIEDAGDLREAVAEAEGGKEIALSVQRDGRPLDVKVTLANPQPPKHRRAAGVSL